MPNFKASNGWFDHWKKRYNIHKMKINGESGDVAEETVVLGGREFLSFLRDIRPRMFEILTKPVAFGLHFQSMVLERKGLCARGGRKAK